MDADYPSIEEDILMNDHTDLCSQRVKDVFNELGITKVTYRQKSVRGCEYKIEVKPHDDVTLTDEQQLKLRVALHELATEWFFNTYTGVNGVIYLTSEGRVKWVGDCLDWQPLIIE